MPTTWAIDLVSSGQGITGSTAATHSGSLQSISSFVGGSGRSLVNAESAEDALAKTFGGSIVVAHNNQTHTYTFDAKSVGGASEQTPFRVIDNGTTATVEFEDMAEFPGATPDWDYNDRSWTFNIERYAAAGSGTDTLLADGTRFYDNAENPTILEFWNTGELARVTTTVTEMEDGDLQWHYLLENLSFQPPPLEGLGAFSIQVEEPSDITNLQCSEDWYGSVGELYAEPDYVFWDSGEWTSMAVGDFAEFTFDTPPRSIAKALPEGYSDGLASELCHRERSTTRKAQARRSTSSPAQTTCRSMLTTRISRRGGKMATVTL